MELAGLELEVVANGGRSGGHNMMTKIECQSVHSLPTVPEEHRNHT